MRKYWKVLRWCSYTETVIVIDDDGTMTGEEIESAAEGLDGHDNNDTVIDEVEIELIGEVEAGKYIDIPQEGDAGKQEGE